MVQVQQRVTQEEITSLSLEALRLIELGGRALQREWDAYRNRKINILDRIAADPGPFLDDSEAEKIREICRRESAALRLGLPPSWGDQ